MPDLGSGDGLFVDSAQRQEDEAIAVLRRELLDDPQTFVLNNMLMSVMFFENYEK